MKLLKKIVIVMLLVVSSKDAYSQLILGSKYSSFKVDDVKLNGVGIDIGYISSETSLSYLSAKYFFPKTENSFETSGFQYDFVSSYYFIGNADYTLGVYTLGGLTYLDLALENKDSTLNIEKESRQELYVNLGAGAQYLFEKFGLVYIEWKLGIGAGGFNSREDNFGEDLGNFRSFNIGYRYMFD